MSAAHSPGRLPPQPASSLLTGSAHQMLFAAAAPQTPRSHPCEGGAGFSSPLTDGLR
jgi:hypothetical protein